LAPSPLSHSRRSFRRSRFTFALTPLAAALSFGAAQAQETSPPLPPVELRPVPALQPPPRGEAAKQLPIILRADSIRGRPDLETVAEGHAEFRQGSMLIRGDRLSYDQSDDLAHATGSVYIANQGNIYTGTELQLHVQAFEGFFLQPTYFLALTGGGGKADRIDFIDENRARLTNATYSSCRPDGGGAPAWLLSASSVKIDLEKNEGVAQGAVLRFFDVPILGAPILSFPLTDARKSGWLPPTIVPFDSKNGPSLEVPYYWNIAPQRDATITPVIVSRRGVGADGEFRYLEPGYSGVLAGRLLANDRLQNGQTRYAYDLSHGSTATAANDLSYSALVMRVSDDNYWKDFGSFDNNLTPRLLPTNLQVNRNWSRTSGDWSTYARVQQWQVLQDTDPASQIVAPYQRAPQLGARYGSLGWGGLDVGLETEFNRFTLPDGNLTPNRPTGSRVHALGSLSRTFGTAGWSLVPRVSFNAASYSLDQPLDGRTSASRVIPTVSLDSAWTFERDTSFFGRAFRQTLEPRLLYVNTPYRQQSNLPNFDAAVRDFNFESIYTDNAFSGIDRVSDAHQLTAGVTTRFLDPNTGAEALRLGAAQRYLFRDQLVTPDDGPPLTKRFSDVLLLAQTSLIPKWSLSASLQYSPDIGRTSRSVMSAVYQPAPFHTLSATYNFTRGSSEQINLGWQWPIYHSGDAGRSKLADSMAARSQCSGTLYAVGRVNYSKPDAQITDSIVGVEYDAGCWIGRVVAERLSTGLSETHTRLMVQVEFVGLSRLGTNPLKVLKDNVPGYTLLRADRAAPSVAPSYD